MQIFLTVSFKTTLLFLLYATIISSSPPRNLQYNDNPDSNLPPGEIALYPSSGYYVAYVYVQNNASLPYLDSMYFNSQMILSLYMTETLMASNCSSFINGTDYCFQFTCLNTTTSSQTLYLPYFEAIGDSATVNVYMDMNTTLTTPSLISSSCVMGPDSEYGAGVVGIIGMGTAGLSPNSSATQYFSIYLTTNFLNNRLLFYFDPIRAQVQTPVAVFQTDANWQINASTTSIRIKSDTYNTSNVTIIFDINSQAIFLPYDLYAFVIKSLRKQFSCYSAENENLFNTTTDSDTYDTSDTPFPICSYTYDNIHALPWINITVGDQVIPLHPEIYVGTGTGLNETILLNMITTNTSKFSEYYVTPDYQNTIILGANFMTYYYTLFDARNGTNIVSMYLANHNAILSNSHDSSNATTNSTTSTSGTTASSNGSSDVAVIVLSVVCGVLLIICLIGLVWCCVEGKKRQHERDLQKEAGVTALETVLVTRKQRQNVSGFNTTSELSVL